MINSNATSWIPLARMAKVLEARHSEEHLAQAALWPPKPFNIEMYKKGVGAVRCTAYIFKGGILPFQKWVMLALRR